MQRAQSAHARPFGYKLRQISLPVQQPIGPSPRREWLLCARIKFAALGAKFPVLLLGNCREIVWIAPLLGAKWGRSHKNPSIFPWNREFHWPELQTAYTSGESGIDRRETDIKLAPGVE
jgi:hypothetical protein